MPESVRKNSFAKIALLLIGVFVSAVVIIIAFNVSEQPPATVNVVNTPAANANTATEGPVVPVFSSRLFAATGTITEKQGNVLTVRANIYIENVLTERIYTVQVSPSTTYTVINQETGLSSAGNFGMIEVGDTITFRADDNLVEETSVLATIIDKLVR